MIYFFYILILIAVSFIVAYLCDNYRSSQRKNEEIDRGVSSSFLYYFVPQNPVKWFDFSGLLNTFRRVSLSGDILSIIDKREVQTGMGTDSKRELIDNPLNKDKDEFWFDFIADTGDGFDPTTTVLYHVTRKDYTYSYENAEDENPNKEKELTLKRGDALVIGGDLVYPAGSELNYRDRFKGPLRFVAPDSGKHDPILIATPGNHDWYDGLTAFFRLMCQQCPIGDYKTVQNRSYFAYKLRENVHLLGVDNQLVGDIDLPQMQFFSDYVQAISGKGVKNHVILVVAEPYWYNYQIEDRGKRRQRLDSMEYIIKGLTKAVMNLRNESEIIFEVVVTGDIHHYSHYELDETEKGYEKHIKHFITSGGGGAFEHLTDFLEKTITIPILQNSTTTGLYYDLRKVYPSKKKSKKKVFWTLLFFAINYKFTALMLLFSFFVTYIFNYNADLFLKVLMLIFFPTLLFLIVKKVANPECSKKEDNINKFSRFTLFIVSLAVQVVIYSLLPRWDEVAMLRDTNLIDSIKAFFNVIDYESFKNKPKESDFFIFQWVFSGIAQSILFGLYIFFSYRFFKLHLTEVSSAKINKGDKNFLKFKVTDTEIVIYVVAIKKAYKWMKLIKRKKAINVQKEMVTKDPKSFIKENFNIDPEKNIKILDKIIIKL